MSIKKVFTFFNEKKGLRWFESIFDIKKMTLKIRIEVLLTYKTKKNQKSIIFYTHQVEAEAKLLHP